MSKILVIEDENLVLASITELLEMEGYQVTGTDNGMSGIIKAREIKPDLIICDVMMPELDGFEVLGNLGQDPLTATIPFIFLTAKSERADLRYAMELGADDYITKPFKRVELLNAIRSRLTKQANLTRYYNKELEEAEHSLNVLSHELRTPLTALKMALEGLKSESMPLTEAERLEYYDIAGEEVEKLERLVNRIYTMNRLENGAFKLDKGLYFLPELINNMIDDLNKGGILCKHIIQLDFEKDLPLVPLDYTQFEQVIINVLENAVKYAPAYSAITIKVFQAAKPPTALSEGDIMGVMLKVIDEGVGIAKNELERIFEKYYTSSATDSNGIGLGLAICKGIVTAHGGTIWAGAISTGGAIISIWLPLA